MNEAGRIVGDSNAARKELCPFEAGVFKMILAKELKSYLFHALKSVCCSRVTHRGLRCGIDLGSLRFAPYG
jgi:hypothetical protein